MLLPVQSVEVVLYSLLYDYVVPLSLQKIPGEHDFVWADLCHLPGGNLSHVCCCLSVWSLPGVPGAWQHCSW